MAEELTLQELSRRTGEPMGRLRHWRSLGLIGAEGSEGFDLHDVERARLVQLLLRRGIRLETVVRATREGTFSLDRYVEVLFPHGIGRAYSLAEAAEVMDVDPQLLRRIWAAAGFAEEGETLYEEDIAALRQIKTVMDAGFPEEAVMQAVRVYADALSRVAEMETRLFYFYVRERLKAQGLKGPELAGATNAAGDQARTIIEPALLYFHQKGWARAAREYVVMLLAEEAGLTQRAELPGQLYTAVLFVDLASFTPLAEAMGDLKAAEVLERFSALVREAAGRWEGRVVKQIGDAFMLIFPDPRSAVACALEMEARTEGEPQFPAARSGIHWGSVLYREGDYVGSNVNVASRVAAEAQRHQVLVTAAVRKEVRGLADVEFVRLGKRRLKGLANELVLFEARASRAEGRERAVDPVCGMELGPAEVAARLSLEGPSTGSGERAFCSDECLRRFVAAPERYGAV